MKKIIKPKIKQEGTFILKLFNILKDKRFSKYIYWSQDGKSFIIPNKKKFTKNVIPKFCNTKNYSSFVRQLNLYDFKKIKTVDRAIQKYKHKEFNESKGEEEIKLIKKPDRKSDKEEDTGLQRMYDLLVFNPKGQAIDKQLLKKIGEETGNPLTDYEIVYLLNKAGNGKTISLESFIEFMKKQKNLIYNSFNLFNDKQIEVKYY